MCNKENNDNIYYWSKKDGVQKNLSKESLIGKWIFDKEQEESLRRFGDYFKVSNSVATLYNDAFVFEAKEEDDLFFYLQDGKIEKDLVFDAVSVKSEKKYQKSEKRDKIIFPYKIIVKNFFLF